MEHVEEEATLRALLSFLDSVEGNALVDPSLSPDASDQSPMVSPKHSPTIETRVPKKKRRNRLKVEIDDLREQARELETQLAFLRSHRGQANAQSVAVSSTSSEMVGMWKNVAARQFLQRQEAQLLNANLRDMVATKAKILDSITRLTQRGGILSKSQMEQANSILRSFQDWKPSWISTKYTHLMAIVEAMYEHRDFAFPVDMFAPGDLHCVQEQGVSPRNEPVFLNVYHGFLTPLEYHAAADVIANVLGGPTRVITRGHHNEDVWEHGVSMTVSSANWPEVCHQVITGRRFAVNNRHLILLAGETYASPSVPYIFRYEKWIEIAPFAKGTEHLQKDLARIAGVSNKTDLFKLSGDLSPIGHKFLVEARVNAGMKNVSTNAFYIGPGSLVLPDKSIYLDNATFAAVEPFCRKYISTILTLASNSSDNQSHPNNTSNTTEAEDAIINIEKSLATILPTGEEEGIVNIYNPVKYSDAIKEWPLTFGALADGIRLTELSSLNDTSNVIVTTPAYFDRAEKLVDIIDVKDLKIYLTFLYLNSCVSYLGQPFLDARFEFFEKNLSGSLAMPPRERTCTEAQITFFPVLVGEYYAQKMFDASREEYANLLVASLDSAMADHIAKLDWLDDQTRAKAEEKLKMITNHVGRSTQKKNYPFTLTRDDYLLNVLTIKNNDWAESLQKIGQEVDRTEWILSGATVGAYYTPTLNQIIFPAAIWQPPFYRNDSHPVQNFGAIGVLVGHEITHGFDSNGRLFDGEGKQANWWTNETALEFATRAECMMEQYSSFTVTGSNGTPISNVNGNLTISENIADNGGLGLAFDAYHAWAKSNGSFDSHGVADDEVDKLFFISLGQCGAPAFVIAMPSSSCWLTCTRLHTGVWTALP
ncbi:hypothetical protein Poli38472_013254 [Pythium oligandrum]|uniref:Uncharacterized protein n=1 Tax=Pythium oligandrum TaxID=41045 RepID=A0A8K1FDZ6_PYTOL|nr:hypothetical protein Poli38472_013254 [Pythium oligandrum]|eukprot:TMW55363.1 hypothetical protein Poli38472_013254 [Pythium oligandrum]